MQEGEHEVAQIEGLRRVNGVQRGYLQVADRNRGRLSIARDDGVLRIIRVDHAQNAHVAIINLKERHDLGARVRNKFVLVRALNGIRKLIKTIKIYRVP